jgi:hypothetical protein
VELQIEEDFCIERDDVANDLRTGGGEELRADLEHARDAVELVDEFEGSGGCFDVEGDDQFFLSRQFVSPFGCHKEAQKAQTRQPTAASRFVKPSRTRMRARPSLISRAMFGPW